MMSFLKAFLLFGFLTLSSLSVTAQDAVVEAAENEQLFSDKDNDFLQLWYYDQVLKMQLNEEGRENYLALLQYYTYKMKRLGLAKYNYTDAEKKRKFDGLAAKLHTDMRDLLSEENYNIHIESFKEIKEIVYKKKNWE